MVKVPEMFGCKVFNDRKMQERLPKSTYKALKRPFRTASRSILAWLTLSLRR